MRVFMEMKRSAVRPDVVAYTSLLAALQGTPQVGTAAAAACLHLAAQHSTHRQLKGQLRAETSASGGLPSHSLACERAR